MLNAQSRILAGFDRDDALPSPDELLSIAKEHIEEHIACVGLLERFDESLLLMRHRLEWPFCPLYLRQNVNAKRRPLASIDSTVKDAISEAHQVDIKLYQYVCELFDREIQELGDVMGGHLKKFRKLNGFYQRIAPLPVRMYRGFRDAVWTE